MRKLTKAKLSLAPHHEDIWGNRDIALLSLDLDINISNNEGWRHWWNVQKGKLENSEKTFDYRAVCHETSRCQTIIHDRSLHTQA